MLDLQKDNQVGDDFAHWQKWKLRKERGRIPYHQIVQRLLTYNSIDKSLWKEPDSGKKEDPSYTFCHTFHSS